MRFDNEAYEALDRASFALNEAIAMRDELSAEELSRLIVDSVRTLAGARLGAMTNKNVTTTDTPRIETTLIEIASTGRPLHTPRSLGVPMRVGDKIVGSLCVVDKEDGHDFTDRDRAMVEAFARHAAIALEIARRCNDARTEARARDDMLAAVSHELRSPLQAIALCASLLGKWASTDERRRGRRQVEVIARATDRMRRLIDDLLQAATIDAGTFSVITEREQVVPIIEQSIEAAEPSAARKSVRLVHEHVGELAPIQCDRERLIQVISNLIDNAIKFARAQGTVRIRATEDDDTVRFSVSDDGPGVPDEHKARIFDRYWTAKRRSPHGAGLGLFISKAIVEALGGKLWVESTAGQGATFFFTVPIARPHT
jgi:signal transduction histidine kinase